MLKPLLVVLFFVVVVAISLNFDFFSNPVISEEKVEKKIIKEELEIETQKKPIEIFQDKHPTPLTSTLAQELEILLSQAKSLFQKNRDSEALVLYEKIIQKSKNSDDLKILKIFTKACMDKAIVHYIYPNNDNNSAIETYELIIQKFQNSSNKELLLNYMNAKIHQSQFNSKDERINVYDELIEKFAKDKEKRFTKEVEELLFTKSFMLMGVNDEEAIEVLDTIIAQYNDKTKLPQTVKLSILNNIELSIITGNETDKYVDLANQYMADSPDTKPLLAMLSIIKNAQDLEQIEALEAWNSEHSNYTFPDWDFSELKKWVSKMETPEIQARVAKYLNIFEQQKYKNYPNPYGSKTYSDESTQNQTTHQEEEIIYLDGAPIYTSDPYLNDIIGSEAEIIYLDNY